MRATVQWMNDNLEYEGKATGGAIRIVGLDANEYDSDFTFKLKAEAAEATENGEYIAAARTVDVTVMRKLQIDPQSAMMRVGNSVTLTANRDTIEGWSYQWSISSEDNSKLSSTTGKTTNVTISAQSVSRTITLTFGPHISSATVGTVSEGIFSGSSKTGGYINRDGTESGRDYFLVEKGMTRSLDFSWITTTEWGVFSSCLYGEPSGDTKLGFELKSDAANTGLGTYKGNKNWTTAGERHYLVTGEEFTGGTADTLEWQLQHRAGGLGLYAYTDISVSADFYVVGLAILNEKEDGQIVTVSDSATLVSLSAPGDTTTLTADWSFPADLMDGTEPTITWTVDNPELVAFGTDINSVADTASGESVSIVARKYSATDYSATITATCTVQCVNGREYTYKKYVSVEVPPASGMTVTVEPCIAGDIAGLNGAFGDALTADSLLAAVDVSDTPVLIQNSAFGCDTLYLKIRAEMSSGFANLNDYFCNLYIDRSFVDMDTALSSDGTTMYVRLKAKEATADVCHLELRTAIGSAPVHKQSIDLYAYPEVALTRDGKDVTNGSIPVYLDETKLSITLNAALTPVLYSADDTAKGPLDQIQWYLQGPDGYDAQSYLELSAEEGNEVTLSIRDAGRMPDFRVVLHARSARSDVSDAGYALVFLPVTKSEGEGAP